MKKSLILCSLLNFMLFADDAELSILCPVDCKNSQNFFQARAFSSYSSNEILMLKPMYMTESPRNEWQSIFSVAPIYMQNFNESCTGGCKNLGSLPFWSGTNTMIVGNNDGTAHVDAYQFGLGDLLEPGSITLNVNMMHVAGDLLFHMTHDKYSPGFYFTIRAPIGAMAINTSFKEKIAPHDEVKDAETNQIWLSYPSRGNRYQSMTEAFQAGTIDTSDGVVVGTTLHKPFALDKGRISSCRLVEIRIADLSVSLGYQFIANHKGLLYAGAKFTCPTGNVPTGRHILEPIFGRSGYWGIGMEMFSHYRLWEHAKQDRGLDFWLKSELLHLCSGRKPNMRTFDLTLNGPGSKYLLLQKYFQGPSASDNPTGFVSSYITQAANLTTLPVLSMFNLEGSISTFFDFHERNWNLGVGAEFWGRSKESLKLDVCHLIHVDAANTNEFAVLGRQVSEDARSFLQDPTKPILILDLCEPLAKINKSLPRVIGVGTPPAVLTYPPLPDGVKDARLSVNRIPNDLNKALNINGAQAAQAMTGKIFSQLGYTWQEYKHTPNLSFIGGIEIAFGENNSAVNLWSLGAQGSVTF